MNLDTPMSEGSAGASASQTAEEKRSAASWNTKKWREDYDIYRNRLTDQNFKISNYADPLLPRKDPPLTYNFSFPNGTKERLQALITKIENTS